ncbi:MAG: hypothetical protein GF341_00545 [candidate division Zixibacteria bacterium]|nr:hypothetical protein [candidate division Zixibacteria bacterium]
MRTRISGLTTGRVLALTLVLIGFGWVSLAAHTVAAPLTISIPDTAGYPGQRIELPIIISTDVDSVVGFQISYGMDRPNVMRFPTDTIVDTLIVCLNPPECTETDTTIDTVASVPIKTEGHLCENWDYVRAVTFGTETNLRVTGLADLACQCDKAILPFTQEETLCRVTVDVFCHPDPFGGDEVNFGGQIPATSFSAPLGRAIESFTLNPAHIDVLPLVTGDYDYSGFADAVDLQMMIQCLFFNTCPDCDALNIDLDCNGEPNAVDMNLLIQYLFFSAEEPVCP